MLRNLERCHAERILKFTDLKHADEIYIRDLVTAATGDPEKGHDVMTEVYAKRLEASIYE